MKCVINPKMQVIYARNVYCSRGANLRDVTARMDGLSRVEGLGYTPWKYQNLRTLSRDSFPHREN